MVSEIVKMNQLLITKYNATKVANPVFNDTETSSHLGNYYFIDFDEQTKNYEFLALVNLKSKDSAPIMIQNMYSSLINHITNNKISINVSYIIKYFSLSMLLFL